MTERLLDAAGRRCSPATTPLVDVACRYLTDIGPRVKPAQKAAFITAYKQSVQALAGSGWLTQARADTLKALANGL